jgi:hypothetical protein
VSERFRGPIKVASRIVDYLSSGLYNSPAACLKELVNNSYDADASRVDVFVKPDADRIVVADDGEGMSRVEFVQHFERISESHKRDKHDRTASGRPKVGKIGIGFIAANELCDVMEIISTKKGSTELLRVEINFQEMRIDPPERRKRDDDTYLKGDYEGVVELAKSGEHYTHVMLKDIRPNAKGILAGAMKRDHVSGPTSVYGLNPESVRDVLAALTDWGDLDEYSQTMLQVGLNVPVRYLPAWHPSTAGGVLRPFEDEVAALNFTVFADGSDLRKPVVLDPGDRYLMRSLEIKGDHVSARGYLFSKHGVLRPQWLNGVLVRIRYAAVGDYDGTFLNYKTSEHTLFQRWTSCEVWADDRLEEALNIDRRTLRITHPAYVELQETFHDALSDFLRDVRNQLYTQPAAERRKQEARREVQRFGEVIERSTAALPPEIRKELRAAVKHRSRPERIFSPMEVKAVLRKYSVADMYELALDVARDTLPQDHYERFAHALATRLLR